MKGNFFVVMEPIHRQILVEAGIDPEQVYLLGRPEGIPDPYRKDAEEFRKVRDQIIASFADLDHVLFTQAKQAWKNKYECRYSDSTNAGEKHISALAQLERLTFLSHGLKTAYAANFTISSLFFALQSKMDKC